MSTSSDVRHLYIHVPFCARRCSYCDFAIAVRARTPVDEYVQGLAMELSAYPAESWHLDTVYLGGGTPSRLGGRGIVELLEQLRRRTTIASGAEITIEANPDDVTPEHAEQWRVAGVNRVSLGVQSFDPTVLAWMHRTHTVDQARDAVRVLRGAGIHNVSIDLIFAVPPSLHRDWHDDVTQALRLSPSHVSLYGLTVEPHTPLGKWRERGAVDEASEDTYEADFLYAHDTLTSAGFEHYEVSNYGLPGQHSRHNSAYWRSVPYAALGPAAHRFDGETRSWNVAQYAEWRQTLDRGESVVLDREQLTPANRSAERVYLGLRSSGGLEATDAELAVAQPWIAAGWATVVGRTIVLTPQGWLRLDALAASLTAVESH